MEHGWPRSNACIEPPLRSFDFSWDFVSFVVFILRPSFAFLRLKAIQREVQGLDDAVGAVGFQRRG
jgi:hypothetical protein